MVCIRICCFCLQSYLKKVVLHVFPENVIEEYSVLIREALTTASTYFECLKHEQTRIVISSFRESNLEVRDILHSGEVFKTSYQKCAYGFVQLFNTNVKKRVWNKLVVSCFSSGMSWFYYSYYFWCSIYVYDSRISDLCLCWLWGEIEDHCSESFIYGQSSDKNTV